MPKKLSPGGEAVDNTISWISNRNLRVALIWAASLATVWALFPLIFNARGIDQSLLNFYIDINVYREGALALLSRENLYTQDYEVGGLHLPFTYPPIAAIVFVPLALISHYVVGAVFNLLSTALLWWCIAIVLRRCVRGISDYDSRLFALMILPVALSTEPVYQTMIYAQVNIALMAMVLMDTLTKNPILPRGFWIGLAAAIKLTPAVFGLYFLIRRDWRGAMVSVLSGVGFSVLPFIFAPASSWTYWTETLTDPGRIGNLAYVANQSVRGVLSRLAPRSPELVETVWMISVVVCVIGVGVAMFRVSRAGSPHGALVLNSLIALLCSPVSWSHHWVWMTPLVVVLGASAVGNWRLNRTTAHLSVVLAVVCTVPMLLPAFWSMPVNGSGAPDWPLMLHPSGSAYVVAAITVVMACIINPGVLSSPATAPQNVSQHESQAVSDRNVGGTWATLLLLLVAAYLLAYAWFKGNDENERLLQLPTAFIEGSDHTSIAHLIFTPLLALNGEALMMVLGVVNVAALVWALTVLLRRFFGIQGSLPMILLALVIALAAYPVQQVLQFGTLSLIAVSLIVVDNFGRHAMGRRGLLTGIAVGLTTWPVLVIVGLFLLRRTSIAVTALVTASGLWLTGLVFAPRRAMTDPGYWLNGEDGSTNVSPFALIARWISDADGVALLWCIVALVLGSWAIRRAEREGQIDLGTSLALAWPALVLPTVEPHLWVAVLPLIVHLVRSGPWCVAYLGVFITVPQWAPAHISYGRLFPPNHPEQMDVVGPWFHYAAVEILALAPAAIILAAFVFASPSQNPRPVNEVLRIGA